MAAADGKVSFKYIMVGDTEVGKSTLLLMYLEKEFIPSHEMTIGVEFGSKTLRIRNTNVKLEIWDTAGQETYLSITRTYYRNTNACLLVYDITRRESFNHIVTWLEEARQNSNNPNLAVMVVGNKADLTSKREVSTEEGEAFAKANGVMFCEASAKDHATVERAFMDPANKIHTLYESDPKLFEQDTVKFKQADAKADEATAAGPSADTTTPLSNGGVVIWARRPVRLCEGSIPESLGMRVLGGDSGYVARLAGTRHGRLLHVRT
eukprot:CAMPEP_0182529886 /NCGR_PEP_ID=MMETSP1323-20130603/5510_1 /TAXON_ID=236787 /ORGANISM="Florenciella parvula, Strain RCC1693" /LENGTH=264 /DNA_ID=CAMNT_0024739131 /DNA_START=210 /DNA_END=1005 /DNA_ORIENTATION=-